MSHFSLSNMEAMELQHEEEIQRNPYNLKAWWNYLIYKKEASKVSRYVIYERSLKFLPRSYKLWHAYLQERTATIANKCITDKGFSILENTYERALVNLYKMPRIWCV
jgi:pre-mRNA-splicing factor SYF1